MSAENSDHNKGERDERQAVLSMDTGSSVSGSPSGGPLQVVSPDRVNRRDSMVSSFRGESRDSSVHEKINQFNNLSIAMQSKQMERKTADAALKRAMVGREEAEAEMKRLRDELVLLRKYSEEGKERERKVGERLEAVMENYGRAKETHAHTQALWEKEIRRARKENFKSQSAIVKLQEELKSARGSVKSAEESLQRERERSKVREQEAFTARYQIVGVQEQLDRALERIRVVEQERDAFKTAAKNEEVARIAAEGRLPLPPSQDLNDEFSSPKRKTVAKRQSGRAAPRVSLSTMEITSSAASEMEIEELSTQLLWERQRAERAQEMVEFLQAECSVRCCPCSKTQNARMSVEAPHKRRRVSVEQQGEQQPVAVKEESHSPHSQPASCRDSHDSSSRAPPRNSLRPEEHGLEPQPQLAGESEPEPVLEPEPEPEPERVKSRKEARRSTIFCPKEGIFRTVSEQEAAAMEAKEKRTAAVESTIQEEAHADEPLPSTEADPSPRMYARTPSVDPPAFALLAQERNSLDFLLGAPPEDDVQIAPLPLVPSIPVATGQEAGKEELARAAEQSYSPAGSPEPRPHTSTASFTVTTTIPLREETERSSSSFNERLRTPSHGSSASFDSNDPAMTPTMTREQALAKIRERRGRARSAAQGSAAGPGKKVAALATGPRGRPIKRDVSAPTTKATPGFKS
ncbi:uncharacterized protein MAM_00860 [Metarhizium album ARSEF 1941]|uniref:PAP2 superfamily protein n=1 Tax=Metarhizium album (strain ARSEF 1941) TaxID=1081103 RepID=A0A0B2X655_METAS|nr:uncharacterized protein MAM_00860 [Metarhizium album ARSEF 1941]KHO01859.1 hypothetical protein MAM_00860 [Metarhizium album ARSEF 1941]